VHGGGYSLDVALQEPDLAATVINYGILPRQRRAQENHAPILGSFGAQDHGIMPEDVHNLKQRSSSSAKSRR